MTDPEPSGEDVVQAVFNFVAEQMESGASAPQIQVMLLEQGLDQDTAAAVVSNVAHLRSEAIREAGQKNMVFGALWCIGGIVVTAATYSAATSGGGTYVVAWGAILFGAIQFFRGLATQAPPDTTQAGHRIEDPEPVGRILATDDAVDQGELEPSGQRSWVADAHYAAGAPQDTSQAGRRFEYPEPVSRVLATDYAVDTGELEPSTNPSWGAEALSAGIVVVKVLVGFVAAMWLFAILARFLGPSP